ncbi:hypothetical protein [Streptomyces sp. NRRL S-350]|uniref:hypothetical protein n=1 Tax=Streptomyces sp. NRRL S-350 TaxID=1463902 RepID=UPI0004C24741|nr:hypothetical protein [Streptomyces sp. NRRL S-350]
MPDSLRVTTFLAPTQVTGTTADGQAVYLRFRWGRVTVDVDDAVVVSEQISDDLDGAMDPHAALRLARAAAGFQAATPEDRPAAREELANALATVRRPLERDAETDQRMAQDMDAWLRGGTS